LKSEEIARWMDDQRSDAALISGDALLGETLEGWIKRGHPTPAPPTVREIVFTYRVGYAHAYSRIIVLDARLKPVFASPTRGSALGPATLALARRALREERVVFSDLFLDVSGRPMMEFLAPLRDPTSSPRARLGVYVLQIDPAAFLFPLIQTWPTLSPTGETLLVEERGGRVVYLNDLRYRDDTALRLTVPSSAEERPAVMAAQGWRGVVAGLDYRGVRVLASVGPVRGTPWYLVTKTDRSEVDDSLRSTALATIGMVVGVTLLAGLLLALFWGRREGRQLRQLYAAERELRASEQRFKSAFDHAPVGISFTQPDGRMGSVNATLAKMLGHSVAEIEGLTVAEITYPDDRAETARLIEAALAGEIDGFQVDRRYLRKDGSDLWATLSVTLLRDELGRPVHFVAMISDIAERKRAEDAQREAERELAEMNEDLERRVLERTLELEAVNKELETFSYSASHDLRAPLRALDGFSLALLEDYGEQLDDTGRDYLARVRAAAQRMGQLIDDLLMLSRVTRREMVREKVDLSALARDVLADLREAEPERAVDAAVADGLVANGDPALLRIVLQNVLANAWKFTSRKPQAHIAVGVERRDDGAAYYVRDDGAGFDATYVDKLFTPFQRLHAANEFPGTGIGLATVKRIVRRHGGSVWAEGAVDSGATFYFTLH
ncbi:MAG: PAS domain S-box protein, partial [Actinobacteria bacterium]|nr:PAS domain S-box protein [Actinomycetota bacterium]